MRPETLKTFVSLCEAFLPEASSSTAFINNKPGGKQVIQSLHKDLGLAHDQNYTPVAKIAWSDLKNSYNGAWVLIQGDKGFAAIKSYRDTYTAVASDGGDPVKFNDGRGGNVIDFIKGKIGQLRKFYVGQGSTSVRDKQRTRADRTKPTGSSVMNQETLVKKFRPLWIKAMSSAIADIKGHVANQIKNDAFEKAKNKISYIESLQRGLEDLEAGGQDVPGFIEKSVQVAILMAASHHYPETTGDITKSYRGSGYSSAQSEGPSQLLKDISQGDTQKLGTVLTFFKRSLISG